MYKVKRFSQDQNSGMSTAGQVAIGAAGAAAVGGAAFLAGRAGYLGKGVQKFLGGGPKAKIVTNASESAASMNSVNQARKQSEVLANTKPEFLRYDPAAARNMSGN